MSNLCKTFKITQRHYDLILKQGMETLPQECGGFFGGKEGMITAVFPIFNQHLYDRTGTFACTSDDINRAHRFFKKHNVQYYGLYHTHPKGIAYPSQTDINTGQRYHFILSFNDPNHPVFAAFLIQNRVPIPLPFEIMGNHAFKAIDIHTLSKPESPHNPSIRLLSPQEEAKDLSDKLDNIRNEKPSYHKLEPRDLLNSEFSTLA